MILEVMIRLPDGTSKVGTFEGADYPTARASVTVPDGAVLLWLRRR